MLAIKILITVICLANVNSYEFEYRPVHREPICGEKWCDCGRIDSIVRFNNVTIYPQPLRLGSEIQLESLIELYDEIPQHTKSKLTIRRIAKISRLVPPLSVPITCINGYGSCTKDLCNMIERSELKCLRQEDGRLEQCKCPLESGRYRVTNYAYKIPNGQVVRLFLTVTIFS